MPKFDGVTETIVLIIPCIPVCKDLGPYKTDY